MAVAQISILAKDEIEAVHSKTVQLLENPGVKVGSDRALKILETGGATIDWKTRRASIPERLVKETVSRLPKQIRLCARDRKQDMVAPKHGYPYMATNGTAVYVADADTGEKHTSTAEDLRRFMVLSDAMPVLDYVWPVVTSHDAPERSRSLHDLAIGLANTTKHFQGEALSAEEAKAQVELASAIVGGLDQLARRPIFSVIQCPICPLEFEKGSVEAVVEFAKAGIPVVSMSMALTGLTSPVTLAATTAIVNAENLASFAISQMTKPGAPVVYSSESTSPNMTTGEIHYGALEEVLLAASCAQMAKRYGAVTMVGGFGVGSAGEVPGIYLDPSELIFTSITSLAMTDFASGIGGLDQAKGSSLEQVVIDCDLWEQVREFRREVTFDDARFALDVIRRVGPGGSFLKEAHTARNLRKELFMPSKEKADLYATYRLGRGRKELLEQAKRRVQKTLATHVPEPLEKDAKTKIDAILKKYSS